MSGPAQDEAAVREPMTGSVGTRILGWAAVLSLGLVLLLGLVTSPADVNQGEAVRLMYVHIPVIWVAYGSFILTAAASALFLWKGSSRDDRGRHYDRLAGTAAEIGVVFTGLTLISGALWGVASPGVSTGSGTPG